MDRAWHLLDCVVACVCQTAKARGGSEEERECTGVAMGDFAGDAWVRVHLGFCAADGI